MKYKYYYWFVRKAGQLMQADETAIFFTKQDVLEHFLKRVTEAGYLGNLPTVYWDREPEDVFESVILCQFIFNSEYFEIRGVAVEDSGK